MVLGCGQPVTPESLVLDSVLYDGRRLREALVPDAPSVVLVYGAAMCYSCSTMLTDWEKLERDGAVNLTLILTPPPTPDDRRALRRQRIRVGGELRSWPESRVPAELVFLGDSLVEAAWGAREVRSKALARRFGASVGDNGPTDGAVAPPRV